MKKHIAWLRELFLLSCMIMLICPSLNAATADSWKQTDFGGSPGEFASVVFLDANTLVGGTSGYNLNDGAMYVSSDGGTTWLKKIEGKANISKVKNAAGTQTVYAVGGAEGYGYEGFLGKSTDGGSTWADLSAAFFEARKTILKLDAAYELPLYGLSVLDVNTLLISGGYGGGDPEVWVSADGGTTWSSAGVIHLDWTTGSETGYASQGTMQFVSKTTGFAASENNLFRTTDSGVTWEKLSAPWSRKINEGYNLGTLTFLDAGNGWALVYDNTLSANSPNYGTEIYKTGNGGTSWTLVYKWSFTSSQSEDSPLSFYTANGVEMWAGSWHKIWHSTDSGSSWTLDYDNASDGYVCVRSFKTAGNDPVPRAMYSIGMTGSYISGYYTRVGGSTVTTTTVPQGTTTTTSTSGVTTVNLLDLSLWDIYGTAKLEQSELIFGDTIGNDPQDQDGDGNPENTWFNGSPGAGAGNDYDWVVSKNEFNPPLTLTWSGCYAMTSLGYHHAAIARKNPAFTGQPGSGQSVIAWSSTDSLCGFYASWDNPNALLTYTQKGTQKTINTVPGAAPGGHGICGEFKIVWENNKVTYFFNNEQVDQQDFTYFGPVRIFFRAYENPFTIESIAVTYSAGSATTTSVSGTTTTIPSSTTTTTPAPCPLATSLESREDIDSLRMLRDARFNNITGWFPTFMYYQNAAEISAILANNPVLQKQLNALVHEHIESARILIAAGAVTVSRNAMDDMVGFLHELKAEGGPRLQQDIDFIIRGIEDGKLLKGIGVTVK